MSSESEIPKDKVVTLHKGEVVVYTACEASVKRLQRIYQAGAENIFILGFSKLETVFPDAKQLSVDDRLIFSKNRERFINAEDFARAGELFMFEALMVNRVLADGARLPSLAIALGAWGAFLYQEKVTTQDITSLWRAVGNDNPKLATKLAIAHHLLNNNDLQSLSKSGDTVAQYLYLESLRLLVAGLAEKRDSWLERAVGEPVYIVVPPLIDGPRLVAVTSDLPVYESQSGYWQHAENLLEYANFVEQNITEKCKDISLWDAFIALGNYSIKTRIPSIVNARKKLAVIESSWLHKSSGALNSAVEALPDVLENVVRAEGTKRGISFTSLDETGMSEKLGWFSEGILAVTPSAMRGAMRILLTVLPDTLKACHDMKLVLYLRELENKNQ
jgi:hypothetical protein